MTEQQVEVPVRRKRGRPRKNPLPVPTVAPGGLEAALVNVAEQAALGAANSTEAFPDIPVLPDPLGSPEFESLLGDITGAVDPSSLASSLGAPVGSANTHAPRINIVLDKNIAKVSVPADATNLTDTISYVTVDALADALAASTQKGGQATLVPVGLRLLCESQAKLLVGFEAPERVTNITYKGSRFADFSEDCVVPAGMTFILFDKKPDGTLHIKEFFQVATKGPVFDGDDMLYVYPGTNIWDDCRVCIGSIKRDGYKDLHTFGSLQYLFYKGINNDDLHSGKVNIGKLVEAYPEAKSLPSYSYSAESGHPYLLWATLKVDKDKEPKPFPYECLRQKLSLRDFVALRGFKI